MNPHVSKHPGRALCIVRPLCKKWGFSDLFSWMLPGLQ